MQLFNIHTIGDLAVFPEDVLKRRFGVYGQILRQSANGIDYSPVDPATRETVKNIGQQITLPRDYRSHEEIKVVILELSDLVAQRVRKRGYAGRTVALAIKDARFNRLSRMSTLKEPTDLAAEIYRAAVGLLERHWPDGWPVRMVGVALAGLDIVQMEQLTLFGEREKIKKVEEACDRIRSMFGEKAVFRAVSLTRAGARYV